MGTDADRPDSSKDLNEDARISCEVCMKQVPASEAKSAEAVDYVVHFCGLDCYQKWANQNPEKTEK